MEKSQLQHDEQSLSLEGSTTLQNVDSAVANEPTGFKPNIPRHQWKRLAIMSLAILLLAAGTPYGIRQWHYYLNHASTDDAYVVGDIIPISARVSGTVLTVHVEDHQQVEVGQLLAQLDPRDFEAQVQQAEAEVAMAEADLSRAEIDVEWERQSTHSETARTHATVQEAQGDLQEARNDVEAAQAHLQAQEAVVAVAQADIKSQQALLEIAHTSFDRLQDLLDDGVVAQQQFDESAAHLHAAQAALMASQRKLTKAQRDVEHARIILHTRRQAISQATARLTAAQAVVASSQADQQKVNMKQVQIRMARARLQQRQAALAQARLQLAHATLRAPTSGMIAKSHLEVGQVVQAGQPLLAIVPLHDVWVEANYKETQLHRMQPGQLVDLEVDAYPGRVFRGTVESISPGTGSAFSLLPPENATGNFVKVVQRVPVKITFDTTTFRDAVLRPGMSVIATVDLHE
jgi:membrane fusion protein (multidrug efflux system)